MIKLKFGILVTAKPKIAYVSDAKLAKISPREHNPSAIMCMQIPQKHHLVLSRYVLTDF